MNTTIVEVQLLGFILIYLLLMIVLFIMKKAKINQSKRLILASTRMTVQLIIAGYVLTYIFNNPSPIFTIIYVLMMTGFAIKRALNVYKDINIKFKYIIGAALFVSSLSVLAYLVIAVINQNIFNPQYTVPLAGMILGNSMTGISIGIKTFMTKFQDSVDEIETMQNLGASADKILKPIVGSALETAIIPTLNSMVGMGIVSLPGMMTGQILSGTLPMTAIAYQIAIMIAICTATCLCVFLSLNIGYKTLINKNGTIDF